MSVRLCFFIKFYEINTIYGGKMQKQLVFSAILFIIEKG